MQAERITLTDADLREARDWLADCEWRETEGLTHAERVEFFAAQTAASITRAVERHYDGGLVAFLLDAVDVPEIGQPSASGRSVRCIWCGHTSRRGEHIWTVEEDARGWECENESACRVRFDAANEA